MSTAQSPGLDREIQEITQVVAFLSRVAARLAAHGDRAGAASLGPVEGLPGLDPQTRLAQVAARAGLGGSPAATVLRLLVAAESEPFGLQCLLRLGRGAPGGPGIGVDALGAAAGYLGPAVPEVLAALAPEGPLVRFGLVQALRPEGALLQGRVAVAPRLLLHLREPQTAPAAELPLRIEPALPLERLVVAPGLREVLGRHLEERTPGLWVSGARGVGKRTLLSALCAGQGLRLLCVDYRDLRELRTPLLEILPALWRECLLLDARLCVHDLAPEPLQPDPSRPAVGVYETLRRAGLPVLFTSTAPPPLADFEAPPLVVPMETPGPLLRLGLWRTELAGCERIEELAAHFRLTPGRIVRVARAAGARAAHDNGRNPTIHDVTAAVSAEISQKVTVLGQRVADTQGWEDLVLPKETLDAMREIIGRARFRYRVLQEWGFQRKLSKGVGLSALFTGPPGTGKTMVASLIARELGLELYQIDLSRVVSKYVGETEKNLAEVFDAADWGNIMLLFDEADALFGKRTEVKSANDRFANMETNYLLQRLERFEGISILTGNQEGSIDQAFKRRLTFRVSFPMPDVAERELLWRRMVPREALLGGDLDFPQLARRYEFSGGNIRNAMLRAAFLAAREDKGISMRHVERAVALEYRDAGMISVGGRLN